MSNQVGCYHNMPSLPEDARLSLLVYYGQELEEWCKRYQVQGIEHINSKILQQTSWDNTWVMASTSYKLCLMFIASNCVLLFLHWDQINHLASTSTTTNQEKQPLNNKKQLPKQHKLITDLEQEICAGIIILLRVKTNTFCMCLGRVWSWIFSYVVKN